MATFYAYPIKELRIEEHHVLIFREGEITTPLLCLDVSEAQILRDHLNVALSNIEYDQQLAPAGAEGE